MVAVIPVCAFRISRYFMAMINWLDNPQASYVIAAYGLAFVCLVGLLTASWYGAERSKAAWRTLQERRKTADPDSGS